MDTENLGIDEASIKNRRDDLRQELLKDSKAFDEITKPLDSFPEQMNELNTIRTLDSFNKITTWFLAISMGTLLWALSNFDKFRIPNTSPPIMPYKEIYTMSIILIGLSSIFLIIIQGILYLAQHRNIKIYTEWKLDYISTEINSLNSILSCIKQGKTENKNAVPVEMISLVFESNSMFQFL